VASNGSIISNFNINIVTNDQMFPEIAYNNQYYLVAWEDRRAGLPQTYYTLITPVGQVLNPNGVMISGKDPSDYYRTPVVASNGENYLISCVGVRLTGDFILASRVNATGNIIDTVPFELSSDSLYVNQIAATSNGNDYLISWTGQKMGVSGLNLYFCRFSGDAVMLDTSPIVITQHPFGIYNPAVSFGGGCYLVVWHCNDNIYGCRILPNGSILDSGGFVICADSGQQIDPAVTSDGHRFFVTWADAQSGNYDINGVFVDSMANVGIAENISSLSKTPFDINISPTPFTDKVNINFNLSKQNNFSINIYDISGKLVKSFANPHSRIVKRQIIWDGKNNYNKAVPNGIYFLCLSNNIHSLTKKIVKQK
jgi:hypothetical protein